MRGYGGDGLRVAWFHLAESNPPYLHRLTLQRIVNFTSPLEDEISGEVQPDTLCWLGTSILTRGEVEGFHGGLEYMMGLLRFWVFGLPTLPLGEGTS